MEIISYADITEAQLETLREFGKAKVRRWESGRLVATFRFYHGQEVNVELDSSGVIKHVWKS